MERKGHNGKKGRREGEGGQPGKGGGREELEGGKEGEGVLRRDKAEREGGRKEGGREGRSTWCKEGERGWGEGGRGGRGEEGEEDPKCFSKSLQLC